MIDHILRGLVFLIIIIFALPVIISLAMGLVSTGKANFKVASHVIFAGLHIMAGAIEDLAEGLAKILIKRYPKQKKILQPIVKHVIIGIFVLVFLTLLSTFN